MDNQYSAVRMKDLLEIDPESQDLKEFLLHGPRVAERLRPDDGAGRVVRDAEHQVPAALIGQSNAVLEEPVLVELVPRRLELQPLVF
jgi:hypothetical protein